jgi:N-glycosylase/DNA lyase
MNVITADRIREAVACIAGEIEERLCGAPHSSTCDERALWRELTCCVLSSQVPYDLAKAAALRIDEVGVLRKSEPVEHETLRRELLELLSTPFSYNDSHRRYRFPNIRANQIAAAFCAIREESGSLAELLDRYRDPRRARVWLVANVAGVGPKQASMFLRNGAGSYDLAILDRHVLQYMRMIELCVVTNSDVTTIRSYERCETELRRHAKSLGYAVGLLDWAIWIVMRTASRLDQRWVS